MLNKLARHLSYECNENLSHIENTNFFYVNYIGYIFTSMDSV